MYQEASDPQPASTDSKAEPYRSSLDKALQGYLKEHYPSGVVTVSYCGRHLISQCILSVAPTYRSHDCTHINLHWCIGVSVFLINFVWRFLMEMLHRFVIAGVW